MIISQLSKSISDHSRQINSPLRNPANINIREVIYNLCCLVIKTRCCSVWFNERNSVITAFLGIFLPLAGFRNKISFSIANSNILLMRLRMYFSVRFPKGLLIVGLNCAKDDNMSSIW